MKLEQKISLWLNESRVGNKSSINSLFTYFYPKLLSYALKICGYNNIAEDALQDAYINAFIHLNEVKEVDKFYYWMLTIVRRSCWQYIKKERKNSFQLSAKLIDKEISGYTLEEIIEKNNMNEFILERITHLSKPLREVILLRYFTEYNDYKNISDILGIPDGTVRSRLNEAKKQLKKIWHSDLSEMPQSIKNEAEFWNEFYLEIAGEIYQNESARNKFFNHLLPELSIRLTSGKRIKGRFHIEKEIDEDIKYGSTFILTSVFNLKDIGIVQTENINSEEYPDRCPPVSTLIFHRIKDKTFYLQFSNPSKEFAA